FQAPVYDEKPLKVALITDVHIDPLYKAFGVADCDEPTCCRVGQRPRSSFSYVYNHEGSLLERSLIHDHGEIKLNLSASDSKGEQSARIRYQTSSRQSPPAGYWGDYRNCDTPLWAYDDAIENIHENHKDIDLIYYVGDTIDHGIWETSYELINDMNLYLVKKIKSIFGEDVLVVPAIGNHESQPTNQFAPATVVGPKLNTTWLYKSLADKWGHYLSDEAVDTLLQSGGFSLLARPGLRVISLNNNVAYRNNWWLVYDPLDSKKHLDWLIEELHKAELAGEKVHILAHIPPGVHDLTHTWTREYYRIVNRFSDTIAAEFNGHTHSDEFKVFYSPDNEPINVAWGGGSVTSYTFYNLNYKIVTFNPQNFTPDRILNYAYNLTEANLTPNRRPHWFLLYDMKNTFGLPDLTPKSMSDLVYSMVTTNRHLLDIYNAFYSKISDVRWPNCNNDYCKLDNLCKIVVNVLWERQRCEELRSMFYS
ncbi:sphingomyelin phosphodiesterase-like, partial [Ostrinia furnacalis]|uniref:sphingomyelin phosphodiesterase-like n=1 Tax=Ostrinia furnacalis TaxID=93504 RepID=UPI00103F8B94